MDFAGADLISVQPLDRADLDRIRDLQRAYFRELRAIVAASEPCETGALITLRLLEWPPYQEGIPISWR